MKIYTKTGDTGTTGLFGGARVRKDDARVEAYGTVDELNAALGVAQSRLDDAALAAELAGIQVELFSLGAELACAPGKALPRDLGLIDEQRTEALERLIDKAEAELQPLTSFILPGGSTAASDLHLARTICRRAERRVVSLEGVRPEVVRYLNRLSDLLFVLARLCNHRLGVADVPWNPRGVR